MNYMAMLIGIVFVVVIPYQIVNGEILSRRMFKKIRRDDEPLKFWGSIAVQVVIFTLLLLYYLGYIG